MRLDVVSVFLLASLLACSMVAVRSQEKPTPETMAKYRRQRHLYFLRRWRVMRDPTFTALTYNTGMFSPTPLNDATHDQRMEALLTSIGQDAVWKKTGVACLQELRRLEDFEKVANKLRTAGFHHQYSFLETSDGVDEVDEMTESACQSGPALDAFVQCAINTKTCTDLLAAGAPLPVVATCVFYNCANFVNLSQSCVECFLDHRQENVNNFVASKERCTMALKENYPTTHGLLLASRSRLLDVEAVNFLPARTTFLIYGYIKGRLPRAGTFYCSHQNNDPIPLRQFQPDLPSENGFQNNSDLNKFETESLITAAESQKMKTSPSIILSSTNNGPVDSSTNLESFFPENFALFSESKKQLKSAMLLKGDKSCTACGLSNPLLGAGTNPVWPDGLLDHVLVSRHYHNRIASARRVFTEPIPDLGVPISESYGVQATMYKFLPRIPPVNPWRRYFLWRAKQRKAKAAAGGPSSSSSSS